MRNELSVILDLNESQSHTLGQLTIDRPLGSMPFGAKFRLIDFPLSAASNAGVTKTMMAMPARCQSILDHVRTGREWQMDRLGGGLFMTFQENRALLKDMHRFVTHAKTPYTAIMGTSEVANLDLSQMVASHREQEQPVTVIATWMATEKLLPGMLVLELTDNGLARDLVPAERIRHVKGEQVLVYLQASVVNADILTIACDRELEHATGKNVQAIIRRMMNDFGANVVVHEGIHLPVHDVKSYFEANQALLDYENYYSLLMERPVHTKAKNEAPARFEHTAATHRSLFGTGGSFAGTVQDSVVFRTVTVAEDAKVRHSVILQCGQIGAGADLDYVIMDKDAIIEPGVVLHGTPEMPIVVGKDAVVRAKREEVLN